MYRLRCPDCGKEFQGEACPNCGCTANDSIVIEEKSQNTLHSTICTNTIHKCSECGKEYHGEVCPNCGCPASFQSAPLNQISHEEYSHEKKRNITKKKKLILVLIILVGLVTTGIIYYLGHSYELKIARYEKKASKFKSSLTPNNLILAENIDSIAQKIFFFNGCDVNDFWDFEYGDDKYGTILVHDYATNETKNVFANFPEKTTCQFYKECKSIKDRLFFIFGNWGGVNTVLYVNWRDNTIHIVTSPEEARFLDENRIELTEKYLTHDSKKDYEKEYGRKTFIIHTDWSDAQYEEDCQQRTNEIKRLEREALEKERHQKQWLYGTWESNGWDEWIGRYTSYVCISENNLRFGYNGQEIYNGPYEIDMESHKIIFDRHDGYYTHIGFNPQTQRLEDEAGVFRKVSNSSNGSYNSSSYGTRNSNYSSTVSFRTDTDVISYTSSHTFKNNAGNRIKINFQGMYVNGSLVTNAPRVLNFNGTSATISVSSPYTGGGAMIIRVDASRGTITDGSGDVFWMVN